MDEYSKWVEIRPVSSNTSERTINELRQLFSSFGLPNQLVSDNGPQFVSTEFLEIFRLNGIKHFRSAPYHPATNGQAERYVQILKSKLRTMSEEERSLIQKLPRFLLTYRSTPHSVTGCTPSELFLGRQLKTKLSSLQPNVSTQVLDKQAAQKQHYDARVESRSFTTGDAVWARDYRREGHNWVPGTIVKQSGPVSYEVQTDKTSGFTSKRKETTDLAGGLGEVAAPKEPIEDRRMSIPDKITEKSTETERSGRRYPSRTRRPPSRLDL